MGLNVIILSGESTKDTRAVSTDSAVTPGDLVEIKSDGTIRRQQTAGGFAQVLLATENTPFNKSIFDDYAIGDQAQVAYPVRGAKCLVSLRAGSAAVIPGDMLESAGNGKLRKFASGTRLFVAEQAVDPSASLVDLQVQATAL
jgi:hypothetical protein